MTSKLSRAAKTAEVQITYTGMTPMMQHNERLANPLDSYTRRIAKLRDEGRRKGVDKIENLLERSRLQWEAGLYFDAATGPYMPSKMLFGNLVAGAKATRGGKKIQRALMFTRAKYPLAYDGPRTLDAMYDDGRFVDQRMVVIQRSRVLATRPIFPEWSFVANAVYASDALNLDDLVVYLTDAGRFEGVGDARAIGYGRFTVKIERID